MYMTETERYLFDLNGYLVIRGVLSEQEVSEINAAIDKAIPSKDIFAKVGHILTGHDEETTKLENTDPAQGAVGYYAGRFFDWGEPLRKLVGHDRLMPYLLELIGPMVRLDHQFAILGAPTTLPLHSGGTPYDPVHTYTFKNNRIYSGFTVASFALTDSPPGAGGFCCIPGSHKSNYPLPADFSDIANPPDCVVQVPLQKGDVVLFTEALTHGTLELKMFSERRVLIFLYGPGYMQWEQRLQHIGDYDWQEHQRYLLGCPYVGDRPTIKWSPSGADAQVSQAIDRRASAGNAGKESV
jgi:hypothetical protein